jgi:mRNA interferase MazF
MDLVSRFEVYLIDLNPTQGSEINKVRPCVVISPNQMNKWLNTIIIAPLTSTIKSYPFRVECIVDGKVGQVALDQIRTVDKQRLHKRIAILDKAAKNNIVETLLEMFDL